MTTQVPGSRATINERRQVAKARQRLAKVGLSESSIEQFLHQIVGEDLHAKLVLSLAHGTLGVVHAAGLAIHVIGRAMAWARGMNPKHCIKQVDRLLSNPNADLSVLTSQWIRYILGERTEAVIAIDWTDFDADDQTTLCAYLITRHGRATPLAWKTVNKSTLAGRRNGYEDQLMQELHDAIPEGLHVTIIADRGFGDQKRYEHLRSLGFDFVVRFRQDILVTNEFGDKRPAVQWLHKGGRARLLRNMALTGDFYIVPAVVVTRDKKMAEPWCLACSNADLTAAQAVKLYGRRFTIEETFRDTKDIHFGLGLSATHISSPLRRDRLLFLAALAQVLLTLLGAASERCGLDRMLKANTTKRRTMSLYNQGCYWYMAIPNMKDDRLRQLVTAYNEVLYEHELFRDLFGVI